MKTRATLLIMEDEVITQEDAFVFALINPTKASPMIIETHRTSKEKIILSAVLTIFSLRARK